MQHLAGGPVGKPCTQQKKHPSKIVSGSMTSVLTSSLRCVRIVSTENTQPLQIAYHRASGI